MSKLELPTGDAVIVQLEAEVLEALKKVRRAEETQPCSGFQHLPRPVHRTQSVERSQPNSARRPALFGMVERREA